MQTSSYTHVDITTCTPKITSQGLRTPHLFGFKWGGVETGYYQRASFEKKWKKTRATFEKRWKKDKKTLNLTIAIKQHNQSDEKAAISGPLELKFLPKRFDGSSPPENFMNEVETKRNIAEKVSQGGTTMHPFHPSHLNKGLMEASRGQQQHYKVSTISLCSSSLRKLLNGYLELPFLAKCRWRWRSATAWTRSGLRRSTARQKTWMDAQHQQMGRTRLNYFPKGATKSTHGCSAIEMKMLILFSKMCNQIK